MHRQSVTPRHLETYNNDNCHGCVPSIFSSKLKTITVFLLCFIKCITNDIERSYKTISNFTCHTIWNTSFVLKGLHDNFIRNYLFFSKFNSNKCIAKSVRINFNVVNYSSYLIHFLSLVIKYLCNYACK